MAFHSYFVLKIVCIGLFICSFSNSVLQSDVGLAQNVGLPFCGENDISSRLKRLILVSTLDGKLSALDVDNGGAESWQVSTGPGSMLSSSIHRLELSNNGQWVRMIPSLSGGLYKFNGEQIEAIPVTADSLLRASFKLPDDLVISGGKESRTYGVDLESGRVLYECSLGGCENLPGRGADGHLLLIQRLTQTVRAVEPRTGVERWNFSVGQHEVKVQEPPGCLPVTSPVSSAVMLKVIVPEGLVCAVDRSHPGHVLWTHKFSAPVVSAWNLGQGQPEPIDLFGGSQPALGPDNLPFPSTPLLYVGMHLKQLYIQESVLMQHKLLELSSHLTSDDKRLALPRIPWNPVLVSSLTLGLPGPKPQTPSESSSEDSNQTTAMSVLYASEYVNGNGYYLFSNKDENLKVTTLCPVAKIHTSATNKTNTTKSEVPTVESPDDLDFAPSQIFIYASLWTWWKEVFLISVTTAVVVNVLIQRRNVAGIPSQIIYVKESPQLYTLRDSGQESSTQSVDKIQPSDSFESRFLTDFIPVHCLGKGGFGIVFEAKNKIDDCHYAIKRIPLPNSEESRERVMREVKALAKLDHQNIVRYFNAWLECPPPGWQESQDLAWNANSDVGGSACGEAFTLDLTGQLTPDTERSTGPVVKRTLQPMTLWHPPSESLLSRPDVDDFNDSYIVFGSPSREVSEAVSKKKERIEISEEEKLDSGITVISDTSADTKTNITDVEKTNSPKRHNKRALNQSSDVTSGSSFNASRMFLFIQMQLCKKKSLKDWLKDNIHRRPILAVINIFDQIVQAVEYVHMQGLIHRDLKPSNIFFAPDGQIKVGDFGLVTAMVESPSDLWVNVETEPDSWGETNDRHTARVGTQLYMSPEQVSGKPYSYKVDIYSLGVILFELLVPFSTQMERIHTLTNLRANKYPADFQATFTHEYELLRLMMSPRPDERPTTYGIRSRPPLAFDSLSVVPLDWHFELPSRRRSLTSMSKTSSHPVSLDT